MFPPRGFLQNPALWCPVLSTGPFCSLLGKSDCYLERGLPTDLGVTPLTEEKGLKTRRKGSTEKILHHPPTCLSRLLPHVSHALEQPVRYLLHTPLFPVPEMPSLLPHLLSKSPISSASNSKARPVSSPPSPARGDTFHHSSFPGPLSWYFLLSELLFSFFGGHAGMLLEAGTVSDSSSETQKRLAHA